MAFVSVLIAAASFSVPLFAQGPLAEGGEQWFTGAYYRYAWTPSAFLAPFFDAAPSIENHGFGLTLARRANSGFTAEFGLGYMPYRFRGAFALDGKPRGDTEYITSKLSLLHLTGSLLWPIQLHRMLALELGVGIDLGLLLGSLERSEAYPDSDGRFHACRGPLEPDTRSPDSDPNGERIPYCEQAFDRNHKPVASNPANVAGAQYRQKEERVPPLMLFPMLPHLALRFAPHEQIAIKLEVAFGLAQFWAGASVHAGFGRTDPGSAVPTSQTPTPAVAAPLPSRLLGKVMEAGSNRPLARVVVKSERVFSPVQTDDRGLFVLDHLAPGLLRFKLEHADFEAGSCETTLTEHGGDAFLHCFLTAKPSGGAISGQVKDEQGTAIGDARVDITGPAGTTVQTSAEGLFAMLDAPEGTYRVRVDAPGYFLQLVELEVRSHETAIPQIILLRKSGDELVVRKANELAIRQQIAFEADSAEIRPGSEQLLLQIADMMRRNPDLRSIEIQGHTDNLGGPERNRTLSQARAEAVRDRLVGAGVDPTRLRARGYGPDRPLQPNDTPQNRAANRRVQFVVDTQTVDSR